jgi:FtsZ-interacting cell division protein ZipA
MPHSTPDLQFSISMVLTYLALGAIAAVVILIVRWWRRRSDPQGLRKRPYTERLTARFESTRARTSKARKASTRASKSGKD